MSGISFLFPGQGSQYSGMGKSLYDHFPVARRTFEEANEALGFNLANLCFEGDMTELTRTENSQPAILAVSVAAFRVLNNEMGITPTIAAGHSLGEITALTCAESIAFADALQLVRQRGIFMQQAAASVMGTMAAVVGLEAAVVEEACQSVSGTNGTVVVSNYNAPSQNVVSGHRDTVNKLIEKVRKLGGYAVHLKVSGAFHSPLMAPAAMKWREALANVTFNKPKWTIVSNVSAKPYGDDIISLLVSQMTEPVKWLDSIRYAANCGVKLACEVGPQQVLSNLMKTSGISIKMISFEKNTDLQPVRSAIQNHNANQHNVQQRFMPNLVIGCLAAAVCTKNNNWNDDEYEKGVVVPYRKIEQLQEMLEKAGREPTLEESRTALSLLQKIFVTKQVPHPERVERFKEMMENNVFREELEDLIEV